MGFREDFYVPWSELCPEVDFPHWKAALRNVESQSACNLKYSEARDQKSA